MGRENLSRSEFLLREADMYMQMFSGDDGVTYENLCDFAKNAEDRFAAVGEKYEAKIAGNHRALLSHATHGKSIAARIILLRDGYVPALNLVREDNTLFLEAIQLFAYLTAQLRAMELWLTDE